MSANPNYSGAAAFAIGMTMASDWPAIWTVKQPMLGVLRSKAGKTNFNKARTQEGLKMIIKVEFLGPVSGTRLETSSNFAVQQTPEPTQGFTWAEYPYSIRSKGVWLNPQEWSELVAGKTQLADIVPGKTSQLMAQFMQDMNGDIMSNTQGTGYTGNGSITGEPYFLATGNVVGNISQSSNADWQAQVNTVGGTMGEPLVKAQISNISALGRGRPDFLQCSFTQSNSVYDKLFAQISATQIVTTQGTNVDYGFETYSYAGLTVFMDNVYGMYLNGTPFGSANNGPLGGFIVGSSNSWWWNESGPPKRVPNDADQRMTGTVSYETMFMCSYSLGNNDIARNAAVTNVN